MSHRVPGLFVTGTDTGVGKTYVGALIARSLVASGYRVGVYKPAASGCLWHNQKLVSEDAVALWDAAGQPGELDRVCPQCFAAPLAPHLAAQAEGNRLDPGLLRQGIEYWRERSDILLVEGAGGLMSPLGENAYVADLAKEFGFPLVVVSRNVLGTLNQTLQTLMVAAVFGTEEIMAPLDRNRPAGVSPRRGPTPCPATLSKGLPVAGLVLNHVEPSTADDISLASNRRELAARCVAPILAEVAWGGSNFDVAVDWLALAR